MYFHQYLRFAFVNNMTRKFLLNIRVINVYLKLRFVVSSVLTYFSKHRAGFIQLILNTAEPHIESIIQIIQFIPARYV